VPARTVDLRGAFVVDLPRGRLEGRQRRVLAVPCDAFDALLARVPADGIAAVAAAFAQALESEARGLLEGTNDASPEDVAYALSAALALRGLGTVRFEQWGHALVLVWRDPPSQSEPFQQFAASIASRSVSALGGAPVEAALISARPDELRFLLASRAVCEHARGRTRAGASWADIVGSLTASEVS
jgi:hypothetical protein